MPYQSQRVAYAYFLAAVLLFGLQVAFGFLSLAKYLGPDPLLNLLNFATSKTIHIIRTCSWYGFSPVSWGPPSIWSLRSHRRRSTVSVWLMPN